MILSFYYIFRDMSREEKKHNKKGKVVDKTVTKTTRFENVSSINTSKNINFQVFKII